MVRFTSAALVLDFCRRAAKVPRKCRPKRRPLTPLLLTISSRLPRGYALDCARCLSLFHPGSRAKPWRLVRRFVSRLRAQRFVLFRGDGRRTSYLSPACWCSPFVRRAVPISTASLVQLSARSKKTAPTQRRSYIGGAEKLFKFFGVQGCFCKSTPA